MSIISSLKIFLSTYDGMTIKTDLIDKETGTFAIALTGSNKTKTDIIGNKLFENNYMFYAKEEVSNEVDRQEMHDFIEDFQEWIETQQDNNNFPNLNGSYKVIGMQVANGMLFDVNEDGTGVYQVQIKLIIKKEV